MLNSSRWRCGSRQRTVSTICHRPFALASAGQWKIAAVPRDDGVDQTTINALLIAESQKRGRNLAARLEHLGCKCWVATTREEVRTLLRQRPFRLVLSTRPITDRGPLMELLKDSQRLVFYSFPVANRFLWIQALPEFVDGEVPRPLGPRDLMSVLGELIAQQNG
jgi:hypothetical protein